MKRKLYSNKGFTLIEVMIAIAIIAVMAGLAAQVVGGSIRDLIKQETRYLVGTIKYAYNQAATEQIVYRLVLDFDQNSYWLESGGEDFQLDTRSKEEIEKEKEEIAKEKASDLFGDDEPEEENLVPVEEFSAADTKLSKKKKFDDEVRLKGFFSVYQNEGINEGQAYIYFFPGGRTQKTMIQLSDEEEEIFYSIIVNPITGRSQVESELIDFKEILED